jgi:hypothetical protein
MSPTTETPVNLAQIFEDVREKLLKSHAGGWLLWELEYGDLMHYTHGGEPGSEPGQLQRDLRDGWYKMATEAVMDALPEALRLLEEIETHVTGKRKPAAAGGAR